MAVDHKLVIRQATSFLRGLNNKQRIVLGSSLALVIAGLAVLIGLTGGHDYKVLYSGLSPDEAQTISQRLATQSVPFELSADRTTLSVPADQLDRVRLDLASKGLPVTGRLGFEMFDKPNWAGSDFSEKVNYQRALEGELERTIQSIDEVEGVRVHLVLPQDSLFTEQERQAKAAVLLKLRTRKLSSQSLEGIVYLVASSVDNLKPENVTVVDANGNVPLRRDGHRDGINPEASQTEAALAEKLVAVLSPVVGRDHIRANVTVEYEQGSKEKTEETYDPKNAAVLTSQITSDGSGSSTSGQGVPGTASNAPGAKPADPKSPGKAVDVAQAAIDQTAGDSFERGQHSESKTYAVGKVVNHVVEPAGGIKRLTAAVVVDDAVEIKEQNGHKTEVRRKRSPEELKEIQDIATAAIGINEERGDHLSVASMTFSAPPSEDMPRPGRFDRYTPLLRQWGSALRYVGLLLLCAVIYMVVLRPVQKQLIASLRALAAPKSEPEFLPAAVAASAVTGAVPASGLELPAIAPAIMLQQTVADTVQKEPAQASRVIQAWLDEDEDI
jgi:flagellar M-ring protein FliF